MTTEKIAQPGPMEQWVRANWQHVDEDAPALIFAREQDAEHDRLIEQNAALLAALEAIEQRGNAWLAGDHDYGTPYADRPEGDRAANSMLAIARAAISLAKAGA